MRAQTRRQALLLALALLATTVALSFVSGAEPGPDAAALWRHITLENPYTSWPRLPAGQVGATRAAHAPLGAVFVSRTALPSALSPKRALRPQPSPAFGSIAVRENYGRDRRLRSLTVVYKARGSGAPSGNWFWARFAPDGTLRALGRPGGCLGCHSAIAGNDFILLHTI